VGVVEEVQGMTHVNLTQGTVAIENRPLQFLVAHRMRTGKGPWEKRVKINEMCLDHQDLHAAESLCISPHRNATRDHRKGIPQSDYIALAHNASFVLCVKGGGLDPSPKAWEAIMLGTIPIVHRSTLDDAYSLLPVVFVREWRQLFGPVEQVRERLRALRTQLTPYYSDPTLRAQVLEVRCWCVSAFAGDDSADVHDMFDENVQSTCTRIMVSIN
jgi:hypothetical protein